MKVQVIHTIDDTDYRSTYSIIMDEKEVFYVSDGEPEDNSLDRNFNAVFDIPTLLRKAYEAGKNGEKFQMEYIEEEESDF